MTALPPYSSRQGLSNEPRACQYVSLANHHVLGITCSLLSLVEITGRSPQSPSFYRGSGHLNSGLHNCLARALTPVLTPRGSDTTSFSVCRWLAQDLDREGTGLGIICWMWLATDVHGKRQGALEYRLPPEKPGLLVT